MPDAAGPQTTLWVAKSRGTGSVGMRQELVSFIFEDVCRWFSHIAELRLAAHWWLTCHGVLGDLQMLTTHSCLLVPSFSLLPFLYPWVVSLPPSQYQRSSGVSPLFLLTVTCLSGSHFWFSKPWFCPHHLPTLKFPAGLLFLYVRVANSLLDWMSYRRW